jgi:phage shock protein C
MTHTFTLDRANGKLMGVCSGLAAATDTDPTFVRLAALLSLFLLGPVALFLYLVAALVAPEGQ